MGVVVGFAKEMKRVLWKVITCVVGGLFVYAGAVKALDPARFAWDIFHFRLVPWTVAAGMALYLPWLEMVCGVSVMLHHANRGALWMLTMLALVFLVALVAAQARGLDVSCGCFGHGPGSSGLLTAIIRISLILAALGVLLMKGRKNGES